MIERAKSALRLAAILGAIDFILLPSMAAWLWSALGIRAGAGDALWLPWRAWGQIITDPAFRYFWLFVSVVLIVGAFYFGWRDGNESRHGTSHGSATWRKPATYKKTLSLWYAAGKDQPAGLVVGVASAIKRVKAAWVLSRDDHAIVLGAPGSGKSTRVILPTLGVIAQSGDTVIVTDPKGELFEASAGLFQTHGYNVVRLDLRAPESSVRWNPLTPIAHALAHGNVAAATRSARELATVLAGESAPDGEGSKFWAQSTQSLVAALALAVASEASKDMRHLGSVYNTLIGTKNLNDFFDRLRPEHPAVQTYGPVRVASEETRQNQFTVAAVSLQIFADPSVSWLTAKNEINLNDLSEPRNAVFIVVPDESGVYYGLASLFVHQTIQTLSEQAARLPGQRLISPVHFILDEFGNLPRLPDFEKALAVGRGKGIRITMALQSLAQLDAVYGSKVAQAMRNSCNTWLYLSSNDVETADLVSRKTGEGTISVTSRSWSAGASQEMVSDTGRRLLTTDEVLRWPVGEVLLLQSGQFPARLSIKRYEEWPFQFHGSLPTEIRQVIAPKLWVPGTEQEKQFEILDL